MSDDEMIRVRLSPGWALTHDEIASAVENDLLPILQDLIEELRTLADSGADSGWAPLYSVIDRAEARLKELTNE